MYKNKLNRLQKFSTSISLLGVILIVIGLLQVLPVYGRWRFYFEIVINIYTLSGLLLIIFGFILKRYNSIFEEIHNRLLALESRKETKN